MQLGSLHVYNVEFHIYKILLVRLNVLYVFNMQAKFSIYIYNMHTKFYVNRILFII